MRKIQLVALFSLLLALAGCSQADHHVRRVGRSETSGARNSLQVNTLQTSSAPTSRRPGTIETGVLSINAQTLTADEVVWYARFELQRLARAYSDKVFAERARQAVYDMVRKLVSEIILYQQVSARLSEQTSPMLERVVDKAYADLVERRAGGSYVKFEKMLASQGGKVEDLRTKLAREILNRQYLNDELRKKVIVTRDELWGYYKDNTAEFSREARSHPLILEITPAGFLPKGLRWSSADNDAKDAATSKAELVLAEAQKRLAAGEDFKTVTKDVSTSASAKRGGDIGWLRKGSHRLKEIDERAFSQEVGKVGKSVNIGGRFYIVMVAEREDELLMSFSQAQAVIKPKLEMKEYMRLVEEHISGLWSKSSIGPIGPFVRSVMERMPSYEEFRRIQQ